MTDERRITVAQVAAQLPLTQRVAGRSAETPVTGGLVSDLLSYVMAQGQPGQLWITVQGHANIVAVAALAGLAGIIIAGDFQPESEACERAEEEGIWLFTSTEPPFTLAGRLYELGVR